MSYTGFVQGSETTLQSTYSDTSAQPTCDYGYGTWNSGTNRGYENYGYGYGYGQDNTTNYGINQRLDMVPHLETDMMQGGVYGSGGERYDSYEACDSRAILSERDLYRSGYDYSELDPEMEMAYEGQYDAYRDQFRMRSSDTFGPRAQGWARDARSGRPMASGYGRMWEDPMGARGQCMPGASRLPSLFSQNIIPEYGMFQGMRGGGAFPGSSRFGFGFGNGMKQMRRTWKTWTTADFRTKKKKRKQGGSPDEPDSKATRTDCSDNSDSDNDEGTEGEAAEGAEGTEPMEKGSRAEGEDEEGKEDGREEGKEDSEKGALTTQDESSQAKRKLLASKKSQDKQKKRQRDRMVERAPALALASSSASDSCSCWTFLSLAGAWPLGSPDKADPVAQIRTSGRGRDPPRGLGGGWPPPPLATGPAPAQALDPGLLLWTPGPDRAPRPVTAGCPLAGRAGALLPAQTGLFSEEEDEEQVPRPACLPSLPTPPPSILSRGWAGPLSPPDPRRKMQHLFGPCLGTAYSTLHLRATWLTPGHPSFGSPLGQVHKLLPSLGREALRQPSSDSLPVAAAAASGFGLRPPACGKEELLPCPLCCRNCSLQTVPFCSQTYWSQPLLGPCLRPMSKACFGACSWVG
uniref:A-kinase anchor protein 8-like isoform X4 n=1 Tax=Castor canadensis TaxID=51338 RepID=A0A8B7TXZ8_CASCN|nr:A-kinase anchor protein 8-like isoform X4 [Castor canadensis]